MLHFGLQSRFFSCYSYMQDVTFIIPPLRSSSLSHSFFSRLFLMKTELRLLYSLQFLDYDESASPDPVFLFFFFLDVCGPGGGAGGSAGTSCCWRARRRGAESVGGGAEGAGERQGAGESSRPTLPAHSVCSVLTKQRERCCINCLHGSRGGCVHPPELFLHFILSSVGFF